MKLISAMHKRLALSVFVALSVAYSLISPVYASKAPVVVLAAQGAEMRDLYALRENEPMWFGPTATHSPKVLLSVLKEAPSHGLPTSRYHLDELQQLMSEAASLFGSARSQAEARLDMKLTASMLLYAQDLSRGVVRPDERGANIHHLQEPPNAGMLLVTASNAPDLKRWLASLAPKEPRYARTRTQLASLRSIVAEGGWGEPVSEGRTLEIGDRGPRVAELRDRLISMGDYPQISSADPELFDQALLAAVQRFQARHGLNQDGVVGRGTLAALNVPAQQRLAQTIVALERMRWLRRDTNQRHVYVNLADYRVSLVEEGRTIHQARVIVGKSKRHQTPEFSDEMAYVVVNPYWNVPYSIATKEILPQLQEDPSYLARENMEVLSPSGYPVPSTAEEWQTYSRKFFPFNLRQLPGAGNALGEVKFLFPNKYNIYLHDTPARNLFAKDQRAFSHGCVRVEDPVDFAYKLLEREVSDPQAYYASMRAKDKEVWRKLKTTIPVHISYMTAWQAADGTAQYRADIYGRDRDIYQKMVALGVEEAPVSTVEIAQAETGN